jgi:dTDP-glucose 4,6-dehydratase
VAAENGPHPPLLVTGGAGFIGSAVVRALVGRGRPVVNVDRLTYAGNLDSLGEARDHPLHRLERVDVCDAAEVRRVFAEHQPAAVLHLAAESHVDRSIDGPAEFIRTNVVGTFTMLEEARRYFGTLEGEARERFRFVHVSTDEVFGSLGSEGHFDERTPYRPSSPYSATKAGSDHLARAWYLTYGLPVVVTNCSNNYGPYQFPEKLVPLVILNALEGKPLPVYGRGDNVRDWLFVEDHAEGLLAAVERGDPGDTYCIGGRSERTNLEVVRAICATVDALAPDPGIGLREELIRFVRDRPGHDFRYAVDCAHAERALGWTPRVAFDEGLRRTVAWYLHNERWCARVRSGAYRGERLGLAGAGA